MAISVLYNGFNSHESEHNLIKDRELYADETRKNRGRYDEGGNYVNSDRQIAITRKEEKLHSLRAEFRKASHYKRKIKVTLPEI